MQNLKNWWLRNWEWFAAFLVMLIFLAVRSCYQDLDKIKIRQENFKVFKSEDKIKTAENEQRNQNSRIDNLPDSSLQSEINRVFEHR